VSSYRGLPYSAATCYHGSASGNVLAPDPRQYRRSIRHAPAAPIRKQSGPSNHGGACQGREHGKEWHSKWGRSSKKPPKLGLHMGSTVCPSTALQANMEAEQIGRGLFLPDPFQLISQPSIRRYIVWDTDSLPQKQTTKTREAADSELHPENLNRKMIPHSRDHVRTSHSHLRAGKTALCNKPSLGFLSPAARRRFGPKERSSCFFQAWNRHTRPFQDLTFPLSYPEPVIALIVTGSNWPRLSSVIHPPPDTVTQLR
jgi:hypothetical protein